MKVEAPAPAPTLPAQLSLRNDGGVITVSGAVHDEAAQSSIMAYLRGFFGADKVKGDVAIDPARKDGSWLSGLKGALPSLAIPGLRAMFDGDKINLEGLPTAADRDRVMAALKGAFPSGLAISGKLFDRGIARGGFFA